MTDPLRSDGRDLEGGVGDRDRDARIEELLVRGLDHYFADRYELAINVWTRVLFIDRGHARARAYIERARSAVAERQRKGDELLHTGAEAFDRGDANAARELLASAVEHGAPRDEALALLARIERLETAAARTWLPPPDPRREPAVQSADASPARTRLKWIAVGVAAGTILGVTALTVLVRRELVKWPLAAPPAAGLASPLSSSVPVPSAAELALVRAQTLYARGRLHDALRALEPIAPGDPIQQRADELKATIQRQLLGREPRQEGARRP